MISLCLHRITYLIQTIFSVELNVARRICLRVCTYISFNLQKKEAASLLGECRLKLHLMQNRLWQSTEAELIAYGAFAHDANFRATLCFIQSLIHSGSRNFRLQQSTRLTQSPRDFYLLSGVGSTR